MILGCIADDFTGATDLASNLVLAGMRVVQTIGIPAKAVPDADAVVIALKSRTAPVGEAVEASLQAARWLKEHGAQRIYFKVCSTFDSTPQGNIGPVAEALADFLEAPFVPVTPAFPANGRTVFQGHLFVGQQLLSDSSMRHHPLTPMTESNLVTVLQDQLQNRQAGLIAHHDVSRGPAALQQRAAHLVTQGQTMGIVDTVDQASLAVLASTIAAQNWPLMVAGSGLALSLPAALGCEVHAHAQSLPEVHGAAAIVSGSCSAMTNAQVAAFIAAGGEAFPIDALRLGDGHSLVEEALTWAAPRLGHQPVLVYATASPETVRTVQQAMGEMAAGERVEQALSQIAVGLVGLGVRRLVVAGGETSGACVKALGTETLRIGPQIDPGVPWCHAEPAGLKIALKSGNFGSTDFFHKAFDIP
ncbi:hypothetical protein LPB72_06275 [Hydrogenophaga crassostreae]|uniref:3-oxo-tetronate kinase n=1 Tax=Hydrogenophaga crassostreae TaxID=1763535 RepID=A0A167IJ62_9BURK|nr:3-oxo-tetronate kinase [Hydrogenophaga crassostreae]AOW15729.1 hypothetical protein LPB072_16440 [Hydrogenophaga crassostreae]OAD42921.1 hypothetical protein LPB72_06275 [Hydrogenophaga crassostreae]